MLDTRGNEWLGLPTKLRPAGIRTPTSEQSPATTPAIPPVLQKIHPIFSTPSIPVADSVRSRCRMDRERFEPGGRECPLIWCANVSVSGRGRRWPTRFRWRAALFREHRAKPATGPGYFACLTGGVDHRCGPVADMAHLRQGPCRNTRPKHLPRPVQAAAGATRVEGPEEGQVSKPTSTCVRGRRLSGGDTIRRVPGRALSAPPKCMSRSNGFI